MVFAMGRRPHNRDMQPQTPYWTAAILAATLVLYAQDKPDVPYPQDFRSWRHVKSIVIGPDHKSFTNRGGIHHYYANDKAVEGYGTGKFPNGSVIVDEGVFTKEAEGDFKGVTLEGDRRALDVMVKNDALYKETGGWGFEHFDRDNRTAVLQVAGRAACYACHSKAKDDHVFSVIRK
jgi:hypothetical protein